MPGAPELPAAAVLPRRPAQDVAIRAPARLSQQDEGSNQASAGWPPELPNLSRTDGIPVAPELPERLLLASCKNDYGQGVGHSHVLTRTKIRSPRGDDGRQTVEFEIVAREDVSDATFLPEVHRMMMSRPAGPGRFIIAMSHGHVERIPLTIADHDREKGSGTADGAALKWQVWRRTTGYAI